MLKNKKFKLDLIFLLIVLVQFLSGCVGTVDSSEEKTTVSAAKQKADFTYFGVESARAISHDKIEISFIPLDDGTTYDYHLHVNESSDPIKLELDTIAQLDSGEYRYVLKDLTIDTTYSLKITAFHKVDQQRSIGGNVVIIKTFDNEVADFLGVRTTSLVPGKASSSVKVDWNQATFRGGLSATSYDPSYYEIYYIPASLGVDNLFDSAVATVQRVPSNSNVFINPTNHAANTSFPIQNLSPSTKYFFAVRAVHKDYYTKLQAGGLININREANGIYSTITTDSAGGAIDLDKNSLSLQNGIADKAFSSALAFWDAGSGNYYGFRLYIKKFEGTDIENSDEISQEYLTELTGGGNYKNLLVGDGGTPCYSVADGTTSITVTSDLNTDAAKVACYDLSSSTLSLTLGGLSAYSGYHVKIALCQEEGCPIETNDPKAGILSNVRNVFTKPVLAPFWGIDSIDNPTDNTNTDRISVNFNAVVVSAGYADTFELYCVDPANETNYVRIPNDGLAVAASGIADCDGLTATRVSGGGILSSLDSFVSISDSTGVYVHGVNPNGSTKYCFAITPAITQRGDAPISEYDYDASGHLRIAEDQRVVKCLTPSLQVPTALQFTGVDGICSVSGDSATVSWTAPSGGLFDQYKVYYRKKNSGGAFSYLSAREGGADYTSASVASGTTTYTATGLEPGEVYEIGVLTSLDNGGDTYFSESNAGIVECDIPLPTAGFEEWTRILAVGPKIDGKIPLKQDTTDDNDWPAIRTPDNGGLESRIFEAVTPQGQLYEVADTTEIFINPPGEVKGVFASTNANTFDGTLDNMSGVDAAGSNTGIISLAWEHVSLDLLQTEFNAQLTCTSDADANTGGYCDHKAAVPRNERLYGYRVYRSADYGSSWVNLTKLGESGSDERLVHPLDYTYRPSPNQSTTTVKMGFFTDYSARYIPSNKDIDRARVYLYKVVPVYNGKELSYDDANSSNPHNIIRVTLPPPNMALIHRKMANRSLCMEVGKHAVIDKFNHYRCDWNGLGSVSKGFPYQIGNTSIDQGSDLLVDRFELGCQFTRGSNNPTFHTSASHFYRTDVSNQSWSHLSTFNGFATDSGGADNTGASFRGCVSMDVDDNRLGVSFGFDISDTDADPYSGATSLDYQKTVYGDCFGEDKVVPIPDSYCPGANNGCMYVTNYIFPGAYGSDSNIALAYPAFDNTVNNPDRPQFAYGDDHAATNNYQAQFSDNAGARVMGLFDRDFQRNYVAQAEFGAVYHNAGDLSGGRRRIRKYGPGYSSSDSAHEDLISHFPSYHFQVSNCSINLPSIDSGGRWSSRWFSMRELETFRYYNASEGVTSANSYISVFDKTIDEVRTAKALYDDWQSANKEYRDPISMNVNHFNSDRLAGDMPLGRVLSSNNAKLPPLRGSQEGLSKICETYRVQVGIGSDAGAFQAMAAPGQKRILTRKEHLLAGAFPDHEDFTANMITAIENGTGIQSGQKYLNGTSTNEFRVSSCKSNSHEIDDEGNFNFSINTLLDSTYSSFENDNKTIITGSGRLDGSNYSDSKRTEYHTEHCQSRYGIQDLAGNVQEITSEQFFCDYEAATMALYFGDFNSGVGTISDSVLINFDISSGYNIYYDVNATICKVNFTNTDPDAGGTEWVLSGTHDYGGTTYDKFCRSSNKPWRFQDVATGYCSLVDNEKDRPDNAGNYIDVYNNFKEILNADGTVDSSMITQENSVNMKALADSRNGDARFLNFGSANLGPNLSVDNSLSFLDKASVANDATQENLYFSPVLGIPLACKNYGSVDSCDVTDTSDNLEYSLSTYESHHAGGVFPAMENSSFFIGNSAGFSPGIAEVDGGDTPITLTVGEATDTSSRRVITEIIEVRASSDNDDPILETVESFTYTRDYTPEQDVDVYQLYWSTNRQVFGLRNGGRHDQATTGRYSLDMGSRFDYNRNGARCAISINGDE